MKCVLQEDPVAHLSMLCMQGLSERGLGPEHEERCNYELGVMKDGGWAPVILLAYDICREARKRGILMNDGRGSAGASVVCYCLGITNFDPLEYDLVFERFLNPARVSPPDIDLDFQHDRRQEIIDYIREKYGARHVAHIVSFSKFGLRSAIREAGRAMGIQSSVLDRMISCFPHGAYVDKDSGQVLDLGDASDPERLRVLLDEHPGFADIVEVLLNRPQHTSRHAAGIVVSSKPLDTVMPLRLTNSGGTKVYMTQWEAGQLEKLGCIKFDILGVDSITMVRECLDLIEDPPDLDAIDFEDPAIYDQICQGHVLGAFQIHTETARRTVATIQPRTFRELYGLSAVGRPGAIEFTEQYAARQPSYLHPSLEPILSETYGVIVFQEQFMAVCSAIAGMSSSEADRVRRLIGKKLHRGSKEVLAVRKLFLDGCAETGVVPAEIAEDIWARMEAATRYAFNKPHAVSYGGRWAFKTMWLKHYYPTEFMCAFLNNALFGPSEGRTKKIIRGLDECRRIGVSVRPLDIRKSSDRFRIEDGGMRIPLTAIKGIGATSVSPLLRRKTRNFPDMSTFVRFRLCSLVIAKKLVLAGAFDYMERPRSELMEALRRAVVGAEFQQDLFPSKVPGSWTEAKTIHHEVSSLGFFM